MEAPVAAPAPPTDATMDVDAAAGPAPAAGAAPEAAADKPASPSADDKQGKEQQQGQPKTASKPKSDATPPGDAGTGSRVRRERKQVERFQVAEPKETEELAIPEGKGAKLRDIPNVAHKMGKLTGKDELMEGLHNVLYRRKGAANQRKKAILDFHGFAFAEEQQASRGGPREKELEARKASLGKWKLDLLHKLMDVLDLARGSGDKAAKVDRVLEFLQEPKALSDVDLAAKEADKKAKEKAKRERAAAKKEKEKAKKEKAETAKRKSSGGVSRPAKKAKVEEPEEESEVEEEEEASEEEGSDFEAEIRPKQGKGGSSTKRARRAAAVADDGEQGAAAMESEQADERHAAAAVEDPAAQVPADELRQAVAAVLADVPVAELHTITAKPILKKLGEKYGFSLKARKPEVVDLAHDYVVAHLQEAGEPAEEGEAEQEDAPAAAAAGESAPTDEAVPAAEGEPAA